MRALLTALALLCAPALQSCDVPPAEASPFKVIPGGCNKNHPCPQPQTNPSSPPIFAVSDVSVNESAGTVTVHVVKSGGNGLASQLTYSTNDKTAVAGSDYTAASGTLNYTAGQTDATFTVPITNDSTVESSETFGVSIAVVSNGGSVRYGVVTIIDNDIAAPPPPPTMQMCPDGSHIPVTDTCPTPIPPSGDVASPTIAGLAPIASEFDPFTVISANEVPGSSAPDVGAFRFECGAGQLAYNDPLVYPGQPGKSHLHQFYGNLSADANSTYQSLRTSGKSTCGDANGNAGNRSAYWMPAMLDGKGNVVQPDSVSIYYKRWPASSFHCNTRNDYPNGFDVEGQACVPLPAGIRFIFGRNMLNLSEAPTGAFQFVCSSSPVNNETLSQALARCAAGGYVGARIFAPACWDGRRLDSADHRSHVAYPKYSNNPDGSDGWGYQRCDAQHPYVIPEFTLTATYRVLPGEDTSTWHLSSDEMAPGEQRGSTYHADYFEAWDPTLRAMWNDNCIDKNLNCAGGNLGSGYVLSGANTGHFLVNGVWVTAPTNPNRLVPVPAKP